MALPARLTACWSRSTLRSNDWYIAHGHTAPNQGQLSACRLMEDIDAVHVELAAKGAPCMRAPVERASGMHTVHFRDQDGNIWKIARLLSEESNEGQESGV